MNTTLLSTACAVVLTLAGCGTLSDVDRDGRTDTPIFPDLNDATFKTGSYPNLADLRQVREGMTRDQLYALLGRPHFAEGFKVREWDYLFHFDRAGVTQTCQYKVLFDADRIARSVYWSPDACADVLQSGQASASAQPLGRK